jgi:predicted TIM-barrel fold metal-dependent hydrolase
MTGDLRSGASQYAPKPLRKALHSFTVSRRLRRQFCFGTDYPMFDPAELLGEFDALNLPEQVARRVMNDNAAELLANATPNRG